MSFPNSVGSNSSASVNATPGMNATEGESYQFKTNQRFIDGMSTSGGDSFQTGFSAGRPKLPTFVPPSTQEAPGVSDSTTLEESDLQYKQMALDFARGYYDAAVAIAPSIPSDTDRVIFLNYLKILGEALNKAAEQIYELQIAQAEASGKLRKAEEDANIAMQEKRKSERTEEANKKTAVDKDQDKLAGFVSFLSSIGPWAQAFSIAAAILSLGSAAPLTVAINLAMLALTAADTIGKAFGLDSITNLVFGALTQVLVNEFGMDPTAAAILSNVIMIAAIVAGSAAAAGGMTAIFGSGFRLGSATAGAVRSGLTSTALIIARSPLVQNTTETIVYTQMMSDFPPPKDEKEAQSNRDNAHRTAEMVALGVGMASSIVLSATAVFYSNQTSAVMTNLTKAISRTRLVLDVGEKLTMLATAGVGIGVAIIKKQIKDLEGQIAQIRAAADAQEVFTQDIIEALQKIIKLILDLLSGVAASVSTIQDLNIKKTEDLSRVVNNIRG